MSESKNTPAQALAHGWLLTFCKHANSHISIDPEMFNRSLSEAWEITQNLLSLNEDQLTNAIAKEFDLTTASLPGPIDEAILDYIPEKIAIRYTVFPLEVTETKIVVATGEPFNAETLSMIGFLSALRVEVAVAPPKKIENWINQHYGTAIKGETAVKIKAENGTSPQIHKENIAAKHSSIVSIVSDMLFEAFTLNASDIHVEPYEEGGIIRYRVDGILRVITKLPRVVLQPIIQRLKAISGLNLANHLIPQDGSVSLVVSDKPVDLRISTIPVAGGEKAVIRLLVQSSVGSINDLGLPQEQLQQLKNILSHQSGVLVITGPTGSGKSTTLYSALKSLNTPERCLVTVEDPVEYKIDGIAQISVNAAQNITFNSALRHILRQDPDIILVGEVRDEVTAETSFRAAITGHFVMTTLHTNDAITTIPRLVGLGVSETIIADSLRGLIAQRLVRKLCTSCASPEISDNNLLSQRFLSIFPDAQIKSPRGCSACDNIGYKGRIPILEIIEVDHQLADAIRARADTGLLRDAALKAGNKPMSMIAVDMIKNGKTSAEEIHRALGEQFWTDINADQANPI